MICVGFGNSENSRGLKFNGFQKIKRPRKFKRKASIAKK